MTGRRPGAWAPALLLAAQTVFLAWLLWPEAALHPVPVNDEVFHQAAALHGREILAGRAAQVLDPWFPFWGLGYPLWHAYQPLPHLATAALARLVSDAGFTPLFAGIKFALLLLFPICVWRGALAAGCAPRAAVAAALVAPWLSTPSLNGLELGSYLWRGTGLYTQLWASCLLPLAIGSSVAALRGRGRPLVAGALQAATFLCHGIYGWISVGSALIAAAILRRDAPAGLAGRLVRLLLSAAVPVAFFILPMLLDGAEINHSRWVPSWRWDSFGHEAVLSWLVTGRLFDDGRWPVVTLLVCGGLALGLRRAASSVQRCLALSFLVWLALFFGRATWGFLLRPFVPVDLHLHRLVGAVHLFGVLLAGEAIGWLALQTARRFRRRWLLAVLQAAPLGLLVPLVWERVQFVGQGMAWARRSEQAIALESGALAGLRARLEAETRVRPDRVFAGLAAGWGSGFRVGEVPLYGWLSLWRLDALGFLYHALSRPADVMVLFDESRPSDYDVFDVGHVVTDVQRAPPTWSQPVASFGRFQLVRSPTEGRVGTGRLAFTYVGPAEEDFEVSSAWLHSPLPAARLYGELEHAPAGRPGVPAQQRWEPMPSPVALEDLGQVRRLERVDESEWVAEVSLPAPGLTVLKETFHPGWKAWIDGQAAETIRVTPGFVAIEVTAGIHQVRFRYRASRFKVALFWLGCVGAPLALAVQWLRRRGRATPRGSPIEGATLARGPTHSFSPRLLSPLAILWTLTVVLGALPLLQGKLMAGHDAASYPPSLVEFHENIRHGILAPLWAPDLASGHGQPLFLFQPPLFFWVAEALYASGAGLGAALAGAALVFYGLAGLGAYLAGRRLWGHAGGLLGSAAYLLSPYMLLDLYVRGNLAEFAAVALLPWAAWALFSLRAGSGRGGLLGLALAVAGVALGNVGVLMLLVLWLAGMSLVLAAGEARRFLTLTASAVLLGLGLAAFFLWPALVHLGDVKVDPPHPEVLAYTDHFVAIGWLPLALALWALFGWRESADTAAARWGRRAAWGLVGLAVAAALVATPLGASLSALERLASPWRLLALTSLGLALAAGGALPGASARRDTVLRRRVLGVLLLLLAAWAAPKAKPSGFLTFDDEYYAPQRIAALGMETTALGQYGPRTVGELSRYTAVPFEVLAGPVPDARVDGTPFDRTLELRAAGPATLALRLLAFPGWRVLLDGERLEAGIHERDGRIVVRVPAGDHELRVRLQDTPARRAGKALSLLALLTTLAIALWPALTARTSSQS